MKIPGDTGPSAAGVSYYSAEQAGSFQTPAAAYVADIDSDEPTLHSGCSVKPTHYFGNTADAVHYHFGNHFSRTHSAGVNSVAPAQYVVATLSAQCIQPADVI